MSAANTPKLRNPCRTTVSGWTSRFTLIEIHEKTPSGLLGVLRFTGRLGLTCVAQTLGNAVDGGVNHRQQLRVLRGLFQVL